MPCTELAPHPLHLQRRRPALVLPFFFMGCLQDGHFLLLIGEPPRIDDFFTGFILADLGKLEASDTHFVRVKKSIRTTFPHEKRLLTWVNALHRDTYFVL